MKALSFEEVWDQVIKEPGHLKDFAKEVYLLSVSGRISVEGGEKMYKDFEEWYDGSDDCSWGTLPISQKLEIAFNDARKGMIPEDGAIKIPPVSEWPDWATAIQTRYVPTKPKFYPDINKECYDRATGCGGSHAIDYEDRWLEKDFIPRPKPEWTPKVGDVVFYRNSHTITTILRKSEHLEGEWKVDNMGCVQTSDLKPFDPAKIGKPWSEI